MLRVTENMNYDLLRDNISKSRERLGNLQRQESTMKKLKQPSDNPTAAIEILELRNEKKRNEQYDLNNYLVEMSLQNLDFLLEDLSSTVMRLKEISLNQSNSMNFSSDLRANMADEVDQLFGSAVAIVNRRFGNRYLMSGYKVETPCVNSNGDYQGDSGQVMIEVSKDVFIPINIPGSSVFNLQSMDQNDLKTVNLFEEIKKLKQALLDGDCDKVRGQLVKFDQLYSKIISVRAQVGSRVQVLHQISQSMDRQRISNAELNSQLEDVDLAQVLSDLNREEVIFKNALASSNKLVQPTLLDFLK